MKDLVTVFKAFYIIGKPFGYFPFYFTKNFELKSTGFDKLQLVANSCLSILQTVSQYKYFKSILDEGSTWTKISFNSMNSLLLVFGTVSIFGNFFLKSKILQIFKITKLFDDRISRDFGTRIDYKEQKKIAKNILKFVMLGFIACFVFSFVITFTFSRTSLNSDAGQGLPFLLTFIGLLTYLAFFSCVIKMVRLRVNILNKMFKKFMKELILNQENVQKFGKIYGNQHPGLEVKRKGVSGNQHPG